MSPGFGRRRAFEVAVVLTALAIATYCYVMTVSTGPVPLIEVASVPIIAVVARWPMVLDDGERSIEIGFDSCVLMFLLCVDLSVPHALLLWSVGVVLTQLLTDKRINVKLFNMGVGIVGGAVAALLLHLIRDADDVGRVIELLAVAVAGAGYFAADYLISALWVHFATREPIRAQFQQRGALLAVACFVPFDSLGYLAAVIHRTSPVWTLLLLSVPLATLLVATNAVTRGRENARRLTVLFDAAVRAQSLTDSDQVVEALLEDARTLLRIPQVELRHSGPSSSEIGVRLPDTDEATWLVAPGRHRARSTMAADQQALEAMAAVSADALGRLRLTEEMTHLARHDVLTGLPNRGLLMDRLAHALRRAQRNDTGVALLFVDLDGFKPVNDRFGHAAGDVVLCEVAARLSGCVRSSDTVARLGGDEFALLLEEVGDAQVQAASDRILDALGNGVEVSGHHLGLSASIGIAFGGAEETAERILRNADLAMYEAKARGKDQSVVYEGNIGHSRVERLEMVEALRQSVEDAELELVYQPVVTAAHRQVVGVEALARWSCRGVPVAPDVFITLAESSGLISALGDVVLQKAAQDHLTLAAAGFGALNVSVNISPRQLLDPDFVAKVEAALDLMGRQRLVLELTERDGIGNDETSLTAMERLSDLGVPLAIDDFGVGFSSIGYLQNLPISIVKTDKSLCDHIDSDERARALLTSITMMGEAMGLDVVVEGVERSSQLDLLLQHSPPTYAQGYLFHRPMPMAELLEVLARSNCVGEETAGVIPLRAGA